MNELIKNFQVKTFGCRLNFWESEVIKDQLVKNKINENIIVFNTCSVTEEAERKVRKSIRQMKRNKPEAKIIVTGCAAQINPKKWIEMPEVSFVVGNKEKTEINFWAKLLNSENNNNKKTIVSDIMKLKETSSHLLDSFNQHTRYFLQIQNGCDHRCTFCIIPFGRGNSRSVSVEEIILNIKNAIKNNIKEIVLTGVDLTSWGKDLIKKKSLGELLKIIFNRIPDIPRLRVSSLDPAEIDFEFMDVLQNEERLMPHLHLSVQHGDDVILKRMKRRHLFRDVINFVDEARRRRSDVVFGADFISGFPTETNNAHKNSIKLIKEADIKYTHVFPFSSREGTPAAKMQQLPSSIIKERAKELRLLSETQTKVFFDSLIGTNQEVLVEKEDFGYTPQFARVKLKENLEYGKIVKVEICKNNKTYLYGEKSKFK